MPRPTGVGNQTLKLRDLDDAFHDLFLGSPKNEIIDDSSAIASSGARHDDAHVGVRGNFKRGSHPPDTLALPLVTLPQINTLRSSVFV